MTTGDRTRGKGFDWERFDKEHPTNGHAGGVAGEPGTTSRPPHTCPWAQRGLRDEAARLAHAVEGVRNDTLNRCAMALGHRVAAGCLTRDEVEVALRAAAAACGMTAADGVEATLASGLAAGMREPHGHPDDGAPDYGDTTFTTDGVDVEDAVFTSAPWLQVLRTVARARQASPWAVLGCAVVHLSALVPLTVALPPVVGSVAPLNAYVALVGESGAGKGISARVAAEVLGLPAVHRVGLGSGEGILHQYAEMTKPRGQPWTQQRIRDAVVFDCAEIDQAAQLSARNGATLMPVLRTAWSGEQLAPAYVDRTKRLELPAMSYRIGLVAGVQPGRGHALLDDADGGTPQRFLWLPADDMRAVDTVTEVDGGRLPWVAPDLPPADVLSGYLTVPVCDTAVTEVRAARGRKLRRQSGALDGHAMQTRLRLAVVLAGMSEQRWAVTEESWRVAGLLMQVSDACRASVVKHLTKRETDRTAARRADAVATAAATSAAVHTEQVGRMTQRVLRYLAGGAVVARTLRNKVGSRERVLLDEALDALVSSGQVVVEVVTPTDGGKPASTYRLRGTP